MGASGEACTRQGPSVAREPKGRAFLQRSGREEPRRGGEKSSAFGLRAAPAPIGTAPCNRARGSCVGELMNRSLTTNVGGPRAETRESAHRSSAGTADGARGWSGLVRERSGARPHHPADRLSGRVRLG